MKLRGRNRVGDRTRTVDPQTEPISVSDVKDHTRVEVSADDSLISDFIRTARRHVERRTNRALITQTWELRLDEFPADDVIRLMPCPVQAVNSVKYTPEGGSEQTFASSEYVVDTVSEPARIVVKDASDWPSEVLERGGSVVVEFDAGYGDNPTDVPENLRHAMRLLVAHWYEHREAVTTGTVPRDMERAVGDLVADERVRVMA